MHLAGLSYFFWPSLGQQVIHNRFHTTHPARTNPSCRTDTLRTGLCERGDDAAGQVHQLVLDQPPRHDPRPSCQQRNTVYGATAARPLARPSGHETAPPTWPLGADHTPRKHRCEPNRRLTTDCVVSI